MGWRLVQVGAGLDKVIVGRLVAQRTIEITFPGPLPPRIPGEPSRNLVGIVAL